MYIVPCMLCSQLEVMQGEITWRRSAALFSAAEDLESSTHTYRRRRAAWLRAMRATRAGVKAILTAPQVAMTALDSMDGAEAQ